MARSPQGFKWLRRTYRVSLRLRPAGIIKTARLNSTRRRLNSRIFSRLSGSWGTKQRLKTSSPNMKVLQRIIPFVGFMAAPLATFADGDDHESHAQEATDEYHK